MRLGERINGLFKKRDDEINADIMEEDNGGFVFISHSHKDIKKVRKIRNMMEHSGFEPICFFLKCLTDDDEVEDLIKREIDAREWFVYVDSPNSRKSKWVKTERDYIESIGSKKVINVKLDSNAPMESVSKILSKGLTIFISYCAKDGEIVWSLYHKLVEKEFRVFCAPLSLEEDSYVEEIIDNMECACELGLILAVFSKDSVNSSYFKREIDTAFGSNGLIVPLYIGDVTDNLPEEYELYLGDVDGIEVEGEITEEVLDDVAEQIAVIARDLIQSQLDELD
ncbi:toll/interleukin-1 receptor domain-containing protein [Methanobrevibacter millerae]|uniref:TIR domain-containing protein n=1 Tax=Methanobrevibacter millerae TaxID=230361 RepID=A0A1G5WW57_9EURY|nr:toll/interleukin-1 receptor domain-containing protein [Methanobrevibacter millerae]SDA62418.1 TIR domain-containing protein [Methanobrevibacter millerae]